MSRKRDPDFIGAVQRWSEGSWVTRVVTPSPAGGPHPLKVPAAVWKLCAIGIGVGVLLAMVDALLR